MKKALVIGINNYPSSPLKGCVNDAQAVKLLLESNGNGSPNFDVKLSLNASTKAELKELIIELFKGEADASLLYFSGHGYLDEFGHGYILALDAKLNDIGISMDEILVIANESKCKNKIIILDCCHSGAFGTPPITKYTNIGEGVSILTASRKDESAIEKDSQGIFTTLLIEALKGGATNILGQITTGSIYAFIDKALGSWGQRPIFKTNVSKFISIRDIDPLIPVWTLREVLAKFNAPSDELNLDPSFEKTNDLSVPHEYIEPYATKDNIELFGKLQKMNRLGLIVPVDEEDMYFAAMNSKSCRLTALGYYYWRLVKDKRI